MPRPDSTHVVQFYDDDHSLTLTVAAFLGGGLATGGSAVAIATAARRDACRNRMAALGINVDQAADEGRLRLLDARETLDALMVGSMPDEPRFRAVVGGLIAPGGQGPSLAPIRAYGEMVDLLWKDQNVDAAIYLEELWSDLAERHPLSLLCAYSMAGFANEPNGSKFADICRKHDHVVPTHQKAWALEVQAVDREHLETKLREARDERRRAEEDLHDFVENAVEGLHAADPDGVVLWANQAELTMLGYSREEYSGRHSTEFHVDAPVIEDILARLARGETLRDVPARLRCRDGSIKHVLINAHGQWEHGRFVRSRCFTRDVTYLRQAAEAAQRLSAIVESSDDAIVSKDLNGVVTSWNSAAERVFGYTASEAIGQSIQLIIPSDRRFEEDTVLSRVRRGEKVDHFETVRRRKDGTEVMISLTVSPVRDDTGTIIGASKVARDVTDRKRSEAERERLLARAEQARVEAERANRVKDEFLAILSHELRSPLNAIYGWTQLAAGQLDRVESPVIHRAFEVIERNVALQLRLIGDLLDVSSIVNGKLPLRSDSVDLTALVSAVVDSIRPEASAKRLHVQLQLEATQLYVTGDAARLQQVVWNLLSNALKFTPPAGRLSVTLGRSDAGVRVAVRDSGEGIAPEFLPHVFDRFRQADATIGRRHGGLGLGLAVVQHLVRAHGGSITAESDGLGLGSTFTVDFPAAAAPGAQAEGQLQPRPRPLEGVRLLVVDDDADARDLLDAIFRLQQVGVTAVGSARDALDALRGQRFDVLLSDLAMPDQDGYDLIAAVRRDPRPEVRGMGAVAVTAYADDSYRTRAIDSGFDDYVTKPVDPDRLIRVIESVLRGRSKTLSP